MKVRLCFFAWAIVGAASSVQAAPVEFDVDDAHVIVIRPVDRWSGDRQAQANSLKAVTQRNVAYFVVAPDGTSLRGFNLPLQRASDHELVRRTAEVVQSLGGTVGRSQSYVFHVGAAVSLPPERYEAFARAEADATRRMILAQGDPKTLEDRIATRKIGAGFLAAAVTLGTGGLLGTNAAGGVLQSGISSQVYDLAANTGLAFVPTDLPPLAEPGSFRAIDIRRVQYTADMQGQIVIAYRGEKTPAAELNALARAIASTAGVDTAPEAVSEARRIDFENRQAVWTSCVQAGECAASGQPSEVAREQ